MRLGQSGFRTQTANQAKFIPPIIKTIDSPCRLQSVCQRHALTLAPRPVGSLRGRHGHHSHVPQATLLVIYLESQLNDFQRWLSEWRLAINVSKSTAIIFARARRRFIQPRPVTLLGEPIQWIDTTRYLGLALDTRLIWSPHIDQVRKRTAQKMGMLGPLLCQERSPAIQAAYPPHEGLCVPRVEDRCPHQRPEAAGVAIQVSSPGYGCPLVR